MVPQVRHAQTGLDSALVIDLVLHRAVGAVQLQPLEIVAPATHPGQVQRGHGPIVHQAQQRGGIVDVDWLHDTLGVGPLRLAYATVLPNCLAPLVVQAALGVSSAILEAAALGFLGLGAQPPTPEWGSMLADSREFIRSDPWIVALPGLAILITVLVIAPEHAQTQGFVWPTLLFYVVVDVMLGATTLLPQSILPATTVWCDRV